MSWVLRRGEDGGGDENVGFNSCSAIGGLSCPQRQKSSCSGLLMWCPMGRKTFLPHASGFLLVVFSEMPSRLGRWM